MPASPLTDATWPGLPLLQCNMDRGLYRLSIEVPVLIVRDEVGTLVEVADDEGRCVQFRQAPLRFDLFKAGTEMNAVSDRPGTKSFVVALPAEWFPADGWGFDAPVLRSRFQFADRELSRLVRRLDTHHRHGAPLGSAYSVAVSRTIVDRVIGLQFDAENRQMGTAGLDPEARELVERLVDSNLQEPPTVAAMASAVGMGAVRFARAFKAALGATPHQYVQRRRLMAARDMLAATDAPVAQIALELGFANQAHFASTFRATMGVTPSKYRSCNAPHRAERPVNSTAAHA